MTLVKTTPLGGRTYTSTVDTTLSPTAQVSTVDPTVTPLPRLLLRLGEWLCPSGASCWRVAVRAGLTGLGLTPVEVLTGSAVVHARDGVDAVVSGWAHLGLVGPAGIAAVSPLILAVTAGLTRWWVQRRDERAFAGVHSEVLTGVAAAAVLAEWRTQQEMAREASDG